MKNYDIGIPKLVSKLSHKQRQSSTSLFTKMQSNRSRLLSQQSSGLDKSNKSGNGGEQKPVMALLRTPAQSHTPEYGSNRHRAASSNAHRTRHIQNKLKDDLTGLTYIPPASNFSKMQVLDFDDPSDNGYREIDEKLLSNDDDIL